MYYSADYDQLPLEDFFLPFGGSLDPKNRWGKLSRIMPWEKIEEIYLRTMSVETGRRAYSSRIAFGSIYIKEAEKLTDESCVTAIQENPYMQYFLGLHEFTQEPLFDASMMVHFRKRFPVEDVARINEYVCTGKWPEDGRNVDRNDGVPEEIIDFFNHVMVNTNDGSLVYYYSPVFGAVKRYPDFRSLIHNHCPMLEAAFLAAGDTQLVPIAEALASEPESYERVDIRNSPYALSRRVNALQRLFEKRILRDWNPDLETITST